MDASDTEHARLRKSLSRAFSATNVRASQDIVDRHADTMLRELRRAAKTSTPIDLSHLLAEASFRLNEEWGFGTAGARSRLSDAPETVFQFLATIPKSRLIESWPRLGVWLAPWLQPAHWHLTRPRVGKYAKKLVRRRLHELTQSEDDRFDFVRALAAGTDGIAVPRDDHDMREMAITSAQCIVAGSETTSAAFAGILHWLLRSPDKLQVLTGELRKAFGHVNAVEAGAQLSSLSWLHACICEGMRMYPPSPSAFARVTPPGAPTTICGRQVPADTVVGVHQHVAYQYGGNFARSDEFHPERWLEDATDATFSQDDKAVFQPFSYGPRDCAGRQMAWNVLKVTLAKLLVAFDLELVDPGIVEKSWMKQRIFQVWETKPLMVHVKIAGTS